MARSTVSRLAEDLARDARIALRSLARTPGYTAAVVAILAVAIGATTAVFSVVDGVLLRPLPYRDPDRLVLVGERSAALESMSIPWLDFLDWRERSASFDGLAAYRNETFNVTGVDRADRVDALMFSAGMLKVLGVVPALGREFTAEEDRPGGPDVALVTHAFWRARLGGDPGVLGATVVLDGRPHAIVGVLPAGFRFRGSPPSVVVPLAHLDPKLRERNIGPGILAIGRLRDGVSLAQARQEMDAVGRAMSEEHTESRNVLPQLDLLRDRIVKDVRRSLLFLMGAVLLVLLIAIANVANLTLARGTARQRELAIRAALGAGRGRLVRQLLVESVLLGAAAGAIAVLLALWSVDLLLALVPETLPRTAVVAVDGRVLAFAAATSLGTGLLFGIVPALTISDARLQDALRASAPGAGRGRTRAALVLVEVALAFVLLVGAGLTLRAVEALRHQPLGFDPRDVLTFQLAASPTKYGTPERMRALQRELVARLGAVPGVRIASLTADLPLSDTTSEIGFKRREDPPAYGRDIEYAVYYPVTPQYDAALGIPLLAGRALTDADAAGATPVALVDEELARHTFGGEDPVGRWISNRSTTRSFQIVGVVRHVKHFGVGAEEETPYQLYFPLAQVPADEVVSGTRYVYAVLKTSVPPLSLADAVRAEVAAIDPEQPIFDVRTMEDRVAQSLEGERFTLVLLGGFAALALVLAAMGLYAVMSYAVTRRTHEIGVRMALGAQPGAVQRMVVAEGLRLAGGGLAVGALAAVGVARVGASLVSGVRPLDAATYAAVALVLAAVATAAAWLPARRATRVDPTVALREE